MELCAYLCTLYKLDPLTDGVLICHSEGHKRGIASNHADVLHWFPRHGKSMDAFRQDVAEELKRGEATMTEERIRKIVREEFAAMEAERAKKPVSSWAKEFWEEAKARGITDGTRPQSFITRQEAATMVNSATK